MSILKKTGAVLIEPGLLLSQRNFIFLSAIPSAPTANGTTQCRCCFCAYCHVNYIEGAYCISEPSYLSSPYYFLNHFRLYSLESKEEVKF